MSAAAVIVTADTGCKPAAESVKRRIAGEAYGVMYSDAFMDRPFPALLCKYDIKIAEFVRAFRFMSHKRLLRLVGKDRAAVIKDRELLMVIDWLVDNGCVLGDVYNAVEHFASKLKQVTVPVGDDGEENLEMLLLAQKIGGRKSE